MEINGVNYIKGEVKIPGDKSISHRSAIIASLTKYPIAIKNYLFSSDCINTLEVLKKLGVKIEKMDSNLIIQGKEIEDFSEPDDVLYVGNSGTTIRLMSGVLSAAKFISVLSGDKSINNRPMARIIKPLSSMGANIHGRAGDTKAPIIILKGGKLKGTEFNLDISSAQVKSCLALAALYADGATEITQPEISRDHTERMLEYFGADIKYDGRYTKITPNCRLKGSNIFIPGDISSAAYFIVASLILKKSSILIKDVGINPTRSHFLNILKEMGAIIEISNKHVLNNELTADIVAQTSNLSGLVINTGVIPNIIDEIPILCVAAAFAEGETVISGAGELRFKESDRISSIANEFKKAGVNINEKPDGLRILGNKNLKISGGTFESYQDHRIAMALAILGLKSESTFRILDSECIDTSFPGFKYELKKLTY